MWQEASKSIKSIFNKKNTPKNLAQITQIGSQVRLEVSSKCQLKCPLCITGEGRTQEKENVVAWGNLSFKHFKGFIEENPKIRAIEISNFGEVFLNKELIKMLKFALEKEVKLMAINGVNLNQISDEMAEVLVQYRFEKMKVSIDGASEETYQIYRKNGSFERVIENIKKINYYKNLYDAKYPKLKWQFIIFGHNEHEIPKAKKMAEELGMSFKPKLNYAPQNFPIKNPEFVKKESGLGVSSVKEYEEKNEELYSPACLQLWTSPQINWDGKLLGCCVNHFGDFGNVFEEGFEKLLKSEKYQYAKEMVLGQKAPRENVPCTHCKRYQRVKKMPFKRTLLKKIKENKNT